MTANTVLLTAALFTAGMQVADAHQSIQEFLAGMPPSQRGNARVQLFEDSPLASGIEELWNRGEAEAAIALARDYSGTELGIAWRRPMASPPADWGNDIRIGGRDSVEQVELATHTNGNVLGILRGSGDGYAGWWTANLWSGDTWRETYFFWTLYPMHDISTACLGNHCYVAFPRPASRRDAALARLRADNGVLDTFPGGMSYLTIDTVPYGETIDDVALCSNSSSSIHYGLISGRQFRLWQLTPPSFIPVRVPWTYAASCGLDMAWNTSGSSASLLVSYLDTLNIVRVYGVSGASVTPYATGLHESREPYTSAAAGQDKFLVCFDRWDSVAQALRASRLESTNGGQAWALQTLGDTSGFNYTRSVAVSQTTGRQAAAYWQYTDDSCRVMHTWRTTSGAWTGPRAVEDQGRVSAEDRLPSIAWLDTNRCGIAYITRATRGARVYFDWTSNIGILENEPVARLDMSPQSLVVASDVLQWPADAAHSALLDVSGRQVAEVSPGRNDLGHVAAGVYFAVSPNGRERIRVVRLR